MYSRQSPYRGYRTAYDRDQTDRSLPDNYSGNAFRDDLPEDEPPEAAERSEEIPDPEERSQEEKPKTRRSEGVISSMLNGSLSERFPFGHGIGSEELLIMGIMLAVMNSKSEESHNDMLVLLALLLFSG